MHPTSTCRLGTDEQSVVDPLTMGVHGIEGLAVADASVMPLCPNSATHAPTMMLAEKAADLILGNCPLPPALARAGRPAGDGRLSPSNAEGPPVIGRAFAVSPGRRGVRAGARSGRGRHPAEVTTPVPVTIL